MGGAKRGLGRTGAGSGPGVTGDETRTGSSRGRHIPGAPGAGASRLRCIARATGGRTAINWTESHGFRALTNMVAANGNGGKAGAGCLGGVAQICIGTPGITRGGALSAGGAGRGIARTTRDGPAGITANRTAIGVAVAAIRTQRCVANRGGAVIVKGGAGTGCGATSAAAYDARASRTRGWHIPRAPRNGYTGSLRNTTATASGRAAAINRTESRGFRALTDMVAAKAG